MLRIFSSSSLSPSLCIGCVAAFQQDTSRNYGGYLSPSSIIYRALTPAETILNRRSIWPSQRGAFSRQSDSPVIDDQAPTSMRVSSTRVSSAEPRPILRYRRSRRGMNREVFGGTEVVRI